MVKNIFSVENILTNIKSTKSFWGWKTTRCDECI